MTATERDPLSTQWLNQYLRYEQKAIPADKPKHVTITGHCFVTQKPYSVTVPISGLALWLTGTLIQDAMPDVPKEDREFLVSGTSPEGWNSLSGREE